MYETLFKEFLESDDTLRIYQDGDLLFSSDKDRLIPLVEYLDDTNAGNRRVVILDKVTGNAAALLSVLAGCTEVFSPLGSDIAAGTLDKYSIMYHFDDTVPYIRRDDSEEMCPMENLSLGKDPEEFYQALLEKIRGG
jgi:hypothetical protein